VDVVGALATAEFARVYDGANPIVGGVTWERRAIEPVPGPRTIGEIVSSQEIAPGVRLLPLPGHTPGHMGVAFTAGQQMAVYVGDLVHHPLQLEHPEWSPVFDSLPPLSRETRRQLVERARRERSLILSYHLPFPGIGRVDAGGWQPAST